MSKLEFKNVGGVVMWRKLGTKLWWVAFGLVAIGLPSVAQAKGPIVSVDWAAVLWALRLPLF